MKVRIAHAVLACFGAALMLAAPLAANAAELSTSGRAPKPGQFNPANETVELFEGVKKGQLEVKMVHKDVAQGKVFITNKTDKPVNIKLPDAFVGVHVLAQGMGGMGGGMGGMGGGGAQMSGGGMGVHCVGGIIGALATGILVNPALGGSGIMDYTTGKIAEYDFAAQMIAQSKAVLTTLVWSGVGSAILFFIISIIVGLRVSVDKEREGLDLTDHGERAYNM